MTEKPRRFKILSFDGGGIRGVISARILKEVERQLLERKNKSLHEYFDMVAGTSTGSILAAGVALEKTSDKLINLYQKYGKSIFPPHKRLEILSIVQKGIEMLSGPKYSNEGLRDALERELGRVSIGEVKRPIILILAYDVLYRNTTFFTNCHPELGLRWFDDIPLSEICISSSAAPTYFPPHKLIANNKFGDDWEFPHIDGGVSANNPSLAAISLVMKVSQLQEVPPEIKREFNLENLKFEDISVLSIGTGRSGNPIKYEEIKRWRLANWAEKIVDIFMEPKSEIDSRICEQLMGGSDSKRYLRLQFELNDRYKPKAGETWRDTRELVPENERTNRFTGKHIPEDIDNADSIDSLLIATESFIENGHTYYTRDTEGPLVKDAIANFIDAN